MTPVTRPQGPLPARIYWVRRALVLATAFLLVFGFARILGGGSDGESGAEDTAVGVSGETTGSTEDANNPANNTDTTDGTDGAKGPREKRTRTPLAKPDGPCDPADLTVEADLKKAQADDSIEIPLAISGTADACTWTVSNESLALKLTSGSDMVWSSQQCRQIPETDVVVRSAKPALIDFVWNGRRSDEECSRSTDWVLPGTYHVVAAPFGGEPSDTRFELTTPRPAKIYKTVKPKKKRNQGDQKPSAPKTRPATDPSGAVEPNG